MAGAAQVSGGTNAAYRPANAKQLVAGFRSFGRQDFFVHQYDSSLPRPIDDPSFELRPLTSAFVANAIGNDPTFSFSIVSQRIGDVTYVSGIEARDLGGEIRQGIISLYATGAWSIEGLRISFRGELGDRAAFLNEATPSEYKNASYTIDLKIPWAVLRYMFLIREVLLFPIIESSVWETSIRTASLRPDSHTARFTSAAARQRSRQI